MVVIYLLIAAAAIILNYYIAGWFYEIAEEKGHENRKYFWICFWLGWIGYLLVIALPDRRKKQTAFAELPEI